jgi:Replication-relaxation
MDRNRLTVPVTAGSRRGPAADTAARVTAVAVAAELARITPRDRLILDLLADHRVFTTEQLAAVAFGSLGRARNRLNTLHARAVLDRFRHYQRPGSQSWRWTLGPLGAAIAAAARDRPPPRPAAVRDATARLAASPTLSHLLGVNGFFTALLGHARDHHDAELLRWWPEARARQAAGNLARPDGHGLWAHAGRQAPFWLEHDNATESLPRVAAKLAGYADLAGTDCGFPVLFWLPTAIREANLCAHLARAGVPDGVTVATAATDHAAGHGGPPGRVWHVLSAPGRVRLADIPRPPLAAATGEGPPWDG